MMTGMRVHFEHFHLSGQGVVSLETVGELNKVSGHTTQALDVMGKENLRG